MLNVFSTTFPSGWGKKSGTHRVWTAHVKVGGYVWASQAGCPLEAAARALELAVFWLVEPAMEVRS